MIVPFIILVLQRLFIFLVSFHVLYYIPSIVSHLFYYLVLVFFFFCFFFQFGPGSPLFLLIVVVWPGLNEIISFQLFQVSA